MTRSTFTLALFQSEALADTPVERLTRLETAAAKAAKKSADLLVTPELYMSGYNVGAAIKKRAEPRDGPFLSAAAEIAQRNGLALAIGYPERAGKVIYNATAMIDADGALRGSYRKLHLPGRFEKETFALGDDFQLFEIAGLKVAPLICYDVEFPEAVRNRALAGADLIIAPTALRVHYAHVARLTIPARAFENGTYVAYANHAGQEGDWHFCGLSCIAAPDGSILVQAGSGEELVIAALDPARIAAARADIPYLEERRPDLYHK